MKKVYFFIFYFLGLFEVGCVYHPPSATLEILNYSDSAVYVLESCDCQIKEHPVLKLFEKRKGISLDTEGQTMPEIYSPSYRIDPYQYTNVGYFGSKNQKEIECDSDRICILFIKEETIKNNTWKDIVKNQMYTKKISLNKHQLDSLSRKLTYSD